MPVTKLTVAVQRQFSISDTLVDAYVAPQQMHNVLNKDELTTPMKRHHKILFNRRTGKS